MYIDAYDAGLFFGEEYIYFYDSFIGKTESETDFAIIASYLGLSSGEVILDVGCGDGRLSRECASNGFKCIGLDKSSLMIKLAIIRSVNIEFCRFVNLDVTNYHPPFLFDAAFSWFTSFGYGSSEKNRGELNAISRLLRTGGRFVIDVIDKSYISENLDKNLNITLGENELNDSYSLVQSGQFLRMDRTTVKDGQALSMFCEIELFTKDELRSVILESGFSHAEILDGMERKGRVRLLAIR